MSKLSERGEILATVKAREDRKNSVYAPRHNKTAYDKEWEKKENGKYIYD